MKEPLSAKMKKYVLGLDIEKDAIMLKERLDIPKGALDYFRASSKILIQGVKAGLTLYEIAILCCRNDDAGAYAMYMNFMSSSSCQFETN